MPEFERNPYVWQDYHDQQLRHYGLKRETAAAAPSTNKQVSSQPNFRRNEATGMPVPAAVPQRKPVPGASPPVTPRTLAPAPVSPRTQSPEGTRLIYKGADGRFDPSTIRVERSRYTPPSSPIGPYSRPTSSASSQAPLKRTNSSDSKSSWSLRKNSAGETVRRLSNSLKEKAGIVAMDRNDRVRFVRGKHAESGTSETLATTRSGRSGSVTKSERLALNISKVVDPIKARGRKAGHMDPCIRCNRPIQDFATKGLCQACYKEQKKAEAKDEDIGFEGPQPSSPDAGYMKLPTKRKILRIRQTVYGDPGNPFADENPQQEQSKRVLDGRLPPVPPIPQADCIHLVRGPPVRKPNITKAAGMASPMQAELVGDTNSRPLNPRSKSATLSTRESRKDHDYIAPRSLCQREKESGSLTARNKSTKGSRDTKFYGFYDDIMPEYR